MGHAFVGCSLLFSLLLFAAPVLAEKGPKKVTKKIEGEMIIWSGSKQENKTEPQFESATTLAEFLSPVLEIEPNLVESKKIGGLKPGFHIVTFGVCSKTEVDSRLNLIKAIHPGAYTRSVRYTPDPKNDVPALPCPKEVDSSDGAGPEPSFWSFDGNVEVKLKKRRRFVGLLFSYSWAEQGDFAREYSSFLALYLLIDRTGTVIHIAKHDGPSDAAQAKTLRVVKGRILFDTDYGDPPCDPSGDRFVAWKTTVSAHIVKDAVEIDVKEPTKVKEGTCGYAEEDRMITGGPPEDYEDGREEE